MLLNSINLITLAFIVCSTMLDGKSVVDNLSLGESQYEHGNYQKALSYFDIVLKRDPNNITALYYRANTLVKLGLKTQAFLDYQQAYKLSDSNIMQSYCLEAMSSLANNTGLSALNNYPPNKPRIDPSKSVQLSRSLGTIQLQNAMDKVRIIDTGELFAQDSTMKQQIKIDQMHKETQRIMQEMQDASYYDKYGNKYPVYSPAQIQRYSDDRQQQEEDLTQSIQKSLEIQAQQARRRAEYSQEAATNLVNQLTGTDLPDGVKLDPLGTNLYVRNYDIAKNTKPLPKPPIEQNSK